MRDASPAVGELEAKIHRRLTGGQRLQIALEMSLAACELSLARLRRQRPEWSDADLRRELLRYSFAPGTLPPVLL